MMYAKRDQAGNIVAVYARRQGEAQEEIAEDSAEVIAFRAMAAGDASRAPDAAKPATGPVTRSEFEGFKAMVRAHLFGEGR